MTKAQSTRHRYTWLVNLVYAQSFALCLLWVALLFTDAPDRLLALVFAAFNLLPLVAFVIDVINTNETKEK